MALVADGVARDEADVVAQFGVPARAGFAAFVAGGVAADAGDHGVGVAAVGVDGDPAAFALRPHFSIGPEGSGLSRNLPPWRAKLTEPEQS